MRSISARLERLEHRPQGQIPRFVATFEGGRNEILWGAEILRYGKESGVNRVLYDDGNQAAVDTAALYALLHTDVVVEPKKEG